MKRIIFAPAMLEGVVSPAQGDFGDHFMDEACRLTRGRLLLAAVVLFGWQHVAFAESMVVANVALGCSDKRLFSELMTIGEDNVDDFVDRANAQVDRGKCRWFEKGHKVSVEQRDGSVLMRVHELGEKASYWTSVSFYVPTR
jgi:hypothetical protein